MTANNTAVKLNDIENDMLESMRNAGSIGTEFLKGKSTVTLRIKDIKILAKRIYLRINGKKSWECPQVDKLYAWIKEEEKHGS